MADSYAPGMSPATKNPVQGFFAAYEICDGIPDLQPSFQNGLCQHYASG